MKIVVSNVRAPVSLLLKRWCWSVGILGFALALVSCGVISPRHGDSLLPCGINAEPTIASKEMATLDMSDSRSGIVRTIDGKPFCPQKPCNTRTIILPPGEHEVILSYVKAYSVLGPGGRDAVALTFAAKPGEVYRAIVKTTGMIGWHYNCRIEEESTGKTVDEIEDCDRDEIRRPAIQAVFEAYGGRQEYIDAECYH